MSAAVMVMYLCSVNVILSQDYDIPVYRLPAHIIPLHYTISLTPELTSPFSLQGEVHIILQTANTTFQEQIDEIVLHLGEELQLVEDNVSLVDETNATIKLGSIENDEANQLVTIRTLSALSKGSLFTLKLPYKGSLRRDGKGLFVDSFEDTTNEFYMSSNFYPIHARLAFPGFDEPNFKATFQITVVRPKHYTAVFNSPVYETKEIGLNRVSESFESTPKMAAHSLSLFIGRMKERITSLGPINATIIYREMLSLSQRNMFHELTSATHSLLAYSVTNIYIILLPSTSLTMGGYRIMYFNDDFFDVSNLTISEELKNYQMYVERLLRQYFTFIVTPAWWSHIWLSDGIATYLQYLVMEQVVTGLPGFFRTEMLVDIRHKAMMLDISNRPLVDKSVQSREDILTTLSDVLIKYKGALVLTMLDLALPNGTIINAISTYLTANLYETTSTTDFISILNSTANNTVAAVTAVNFESWFYEPGYPIVSVKRSNTTVILTQCQNTTVWKIPINYVTKDMADSAWQDTRTEKWLGSEPLVLSIPNRSWIVLNTQAQGYYRVNYGEDLALVKEMLTAASRPSRGQIVDDVLAFAAQGVVNYSTALDIVGRYKYESDYFVLKTVFSQLQLMETILYGEAVYNRFQVFSASLFDEFSNQNSSYTSALSDAAFTHWLCAVSTCNKHIQIAEEFIKGNYKWMETTSKIQFHEYICTGVRYNNKTIYQSLMDAYTISINTIYHEYIVTGVGCLTGKNDLSRLLEEMIHQDSVILNEDAKSILSRLISVIDNIDEVMEFLANKATVLVKLYGEELIMDTILQIGEKLTSENHVTQLLNISTSNLSSAVQGKVNLTLFNLKTRINWIATFKPAIIKYFESEDEVNTLPTIFSPDLSAPIFTTDTPTTSMNSHTKLSPYLPILLFATHQLWLVFTMLC